MEEACGLDDTDLRQVPIWSDVLRGSGNVVLYGVRPSMRNTYEKIAALLIGAVSQFKVIYLIHHEAEAIARSESEP